MARHSLKRFAMPFLQASLVKQILIGLILGIALAYLAPEAAKASAFLGSLFISALKAVAPLLVFVLVMSAIANQDIETKAHIKPVLVLYLLGTFGCGIGGRKRLFYVPDNDSFNRDGSQYRHTGWPDRCDSQFAFERCG